MAKISLSDEDRENLTAYLDGELDPKTARSLETKLNLDPAARAEAEALRKTWAMLDYLPKPAASATFTSRTLQCVTAASAKTDEMFAPGNWRTWAWGAGWAAAILVAGVVGFAGVKTIVQHQPSATRTAAADPAELEQVLLHDLRIIENQRVYENIEDITFLRELDDPELFGDDD